MSDHSTSLVPLESWNYNSPELRANGKSIDVGLLAEALIYYDRVLVNVGNPFQFAELLTWFVTQDKYEDFLSLINDGTIRIYDYSFLSTAILKGDTYAIWNIQDEKEMKNDTFEERYLYHSAVSSCLRTVRQRKNLYKTLRGKVLEAKADAFASAIENARRDYVDANRNALTIQAFVDEIYAFRKLLNLA